MRHIPLLFLFLLVSNNSFGQVYKNQFNATFDQEKNTYNFGLFNFEFYKADFNEWIFHEEIKAEARYEGIVPSANRIKMEFKYVNEKFDSYSFTLPGWDHPSLFTNDSQVFTAQVQFALTACDGEDLSGEYSKPKNMVEALRSIEEFDFKEFYTCSLQGEKVSYATHINSELTEYKNYRGDDLRNDYYYDTAERAKLISIIISNQGSLLEFSAKPIEIDFPDRDRSEYGNTNKFSHFSTTYNLSNSGTVLSSEEYIILDSLKGDYIQLIKEFIRELAMAQNSKQASRELLVNNYILKKSSEIRKIKNKIYSMAKNLPIIESLSLIYSINKAYGYVTYYENVLTQNN